VVRPEVHFSPILLMWSIRWSNSPRRFIISDREQLSLENYACYWMKNFKLSLSVYLFWAIAYYVYLFWLSEAKIRERQYSTLYTYVALERGILFRLPMSLRPYGKRIFIVAHFSLFLISYTIVPLMDMSKTIHSGVVLLSFLILFFNGLRN